MRPIEDLLQIAQELADALDPETRDYVVNPSREDGGAPMRRAGLGEDFWQFRPYHAGDPIKAIDWKRSAKSKSVFIKQREETHAPRLGLWCDMQAGFDWKSDGDGKTIPYAKAEMALICQLAAAMSLSKSGYQLAAISDTLTHKSTQSLLSLAHQLSENTPMPNRPQKLDIAIIASDFYDPLDTIFDRLGAALANVRQVILICMHDPVEIDFPYTGRVEFVDPNTKGSRVLGRAETLQSSYAAAYKAQIDGLAELAKTQDWYFMRARNTDALPAMFTTLLDGIMQDHPQAEHHVTHA